MRNRRNGMAGSYHGEEPDRRKGGLMKTND
jgi:hypothetical protein